MFTIDTQIGGEERREGNEKKLFSFSPSFPFVPVDTIKANLERERERRRSPFVFFLRSSSSYHTLIIIIVIDGERTQGWMDCYKLCVGSKAFFTLVPCYRSMLMVSASRKKSSRKRPNYFYVLHRLFWGLPDS